jgi:hypothetical protein
MRDEAGGSGLSCWLDRQTNQRNQRDQTDQIDGYAALEAAFSKSS